MERHFILIVDDEPSIRSSLARLLQREGYDTLLAESAEDGLAILEKKSFSAVISDYRMPGRSGTDFLTEVKRRHPESIRILLAGQEEIDEVMPAVDRGLVSHLIVKPWDNDILKKAIERWGEEFEKAHPGRPLVPVETSDETEEGMILIDELETATIPDEFLQFISPASKKPS